MGNRHYIIPIFVPHEGCPHDCVFCNQNSITGESEKVTRETVIETVEKYLCTIKENRDSSSTVEISFFGGTFTGINIEKQKELLAVAKEYKENNKIEFIRLSTRPDYISEEILDHLKEYDVDIIELGVQSLDEEVLRESNRGHNAQCVEVASKLIKSYGFTLGIQIMLGLPRDNMIKDIETTKRVIELKPDIARIYPALVVRNTAMEIMQVQKIYKPYSLDETVSIGKVVYSMLVGSGIKVIRVGLQPTEEINEKSEVVNGPFHPAIRELIEGSLMNDMVYYQMKDLNEDMNVNLWINGKDISKLYANKKMYFNEMKGKTPRININVHQSADVGRNKILFELPGKRLELDLIKFMKSIRDEFIKR